MRRRLAGPRPRIGRFPARMAETAGADGCQHPWERGGPCQDLRRVLRRPLAGVRDDGGGLSREEPGRPAPRRRAVLRARRCGSGCELVVRRAPDGAAHPCDSRTSCGTVAPCPRSRSAPWRTTPTRQDVVEVARGLAVLRWLHAAVRPCHRLAHLRPGRAREPAASLADRYRIGRELIEVQAGPTADEVRRRADELGAALVVLGSRGRSRLGAAVTASMFRSVLLHGERPVVVARRAEALAAPGPIVCGVTGPEERARRLARVAAGLARRLDRGLVLAACDHGLRADTLEKIARWQRVPGDVAPGDRRRSVGPRTRLAGSRARRAPARRRITDGRDARPSDLAAASPRGRPAGRRRPRVGADRPLSD